MYKEEGNVLFNDELNRFYLRLYGVGHMVKDHSDSERGNPLPPHGSFRLTARVLLHAPSHRQDSTYHGLCYTNRGALAGTRNMNAYGLVNKVSHPWFVTGSQRPIASWLLFLCTFRHCTANLRNIKETLLLIDKSSLCGGSGFPFSLSEWSLTICLTPYNRR